MSAGAITEREFNEYSVYYIVRATGQRHRMVTHASSLYEAVENAELALGHEYEIYEVKKEG